MAGAERPDPRDHDTLVGFKTAWYSELGVGSWWDDILLGIHYYRKRDEPLPENLQAVVDAARASD